MIERDHIELMAHLDRLEQKVQKDSLLIQLLVEQNKGLQEQLEKVTQLLMLSAMTRKKWHCTLRRLEDVYESL